MFTEIATPMAAALPVATGGTAGGAAGGAALGGFLGSAFGNGGFGGWGNNGGVTSAEVCQLRYEVPAQTVALQGMISGLQGEICAADRDVLLSIAATEKGVVQAAHDNAVQTLNVGNQMQLGFKDMAMAVNTGTFENYKCCCEQKLLTTTLDFQGQLRDQENFCALKNGQTEILCAIKDTAKDAELRAAYATIAGMSQKAQTQEIISTLCNYFTRQGAAINQLGLNDKIINPATQWPPYVFGCC